MKAALSFLKQELASVLLIMVSFIPLFFMGAFLDILLTHFYVHVKNVNTGLPTISRWIYEFMAGHRFLSQEIMACFWVLMVILFILNAVFAKDRQQFRMGFIYWFLFVWGLAISTATLIAFGCVAPFDLLLARLEEDGRFGGIIHVVLVVEIMLVVLIPVGLVLWRKITSKQLL